MTRNRQEQKNEQIKALILEAARNIIKTDGFDHLSIRKIVAKIDYSPAIVYHYFKDKNEIIQTLVKEGYQKILASITAVETNEKKPHLEIRQMMRNYVKAALEWPEEYKAVMLRDDDEILSTTGLLYKGVSKQRKTMSNLCDTIQRAIDTGWFKRCDIELTAQIIWTSMFGLTTKLIVERNIDEKQTDRLIYALFEMLIDGLMSKEQI